MRKIILCFFSALSVQLFAQEGNPLRFERIPGLSQSTSYSILKDKQGFLWIATPNGLNRYDGMDMKVYKPGLENNEKQMQGRVIRSELLEDENEQLWFATDLTVHCFNKKAEEFLSYNLTEKNSLTTLKNQKAGRGIFANPVLLKESHLWFATINKGVFDLNTVTKETVHYPLTLRDEAGNNIQLMYNGVYDGIKRLWFASNKGLLSFDMINKQWERFIPDKSFYSLSFCNDTLFICEGKEIIQFDIKTQRYNFLKFNEQQNKTGIERDVIHRVYTDKKLNIWAGDEKGNVYCKLLHADAFSWMGNINLGGMVRTNYPVYCFFSDSSGILWTGAYMLGLMKAEVNRLEFNTFPQTSVNKAVENLFVNAIYEDNDDKVWLGTFQNGLVILDKKTGRISPLKLPYKGPRLIYGNSVHQVHLDSKGNLWTGQSGYLFVKEKGANTFTSIKIPAPSNALQNPQVWSFIEYNGGWLFGTTIGLYYLKKENGSYIIEHVAGIGQTRVPAIWKNNDEVWIGLESEGLVITKKPGDKEMSKKLFTETNVKSFYHEEKNNLLWIATSSGLIAYHLQSGRYKFFTEKDGLLNSYVYGVLPDSNKLWISSNYGLFRAEKTFKKDSIFPDLVFTNFTTDDGLPDNQFNNWAFYKGKSGNLYFGTAKGLVWFNPETIQPNREPTKLRMTDLLVNEQKADKTTAPEYISRLLLPYNKNNLFFRFRGIDYTNPSKVNYAYKMEGWDKDWIYSNQLNEVRYSNLPQGNYLFRLKASNGSGIWNNKTYDVAIKIYPPFWKTWWFYTLAALAVLLTIVLITRFFAQQKLKIKVAELEKQKEIDKERHRISREMHDDIGAGLTQITLMTESVKNKSTGISAADFDNITSTSRKLVNNMSEIIWSLNPENKTLDHLFAYLREELNKQLEYSGMNYKIELPENGNDISLSNEQRRNILLVTKEIVNNAIKYSKAKNILIQAEIKNSKLAFIVQDDGTGFEIDKTYPGNGLKNIRSRIEELGGKMEAGSEPGEGTFFKYFIFLKSSI